MARRDSGDDPRADARIAPLQPPRSPRRRRGDHAGAGGGSRQRRIAHCRAAAGPAAVAVVRQPDDDRGGDPERDRGEGEQRPGEADQRQHEQRRDGRADDRSEAERGGERRERRDPAAAAGSGCEIGLGRRRRGAAEAAVNGAKDREQAEGQRSADPAVQSGKERNPAQQHRDDEAGNAHDRQRLAAVTVALLGPEGRQRDPQDRRPGVGERDPEIGDSDLASDRRHDRLEGSVPRRRDEHRRVQQQEVRSGQRAGADAAIACDGGHVRVIAMPKRRRNSSLGNLPSRSAFANARALIPPTERPCRFPPLER